MEINAVAKVTVSKAEALDDGQQCRYIEERRALLHLFRYYSSASFGHHSIDLSKNIG
jgi:hypothetical protein